MVETALNYPPVQDEWATLAQLQAGRSIARLGDGEFKMLQGRSYVRQRGSMFLAAELERALLRPRPGCIVGIPTLNPVGPKYSNWNKHRERFCRVLEGSTVEYFSALISRPDSAPWINCQRFAEGMVSLWAGKRAAVLCEADNSLLKLVQLTTNHVTHIDCPRYQAYDHIDRFEDLLRAAAADVVLMSCGPSATCLAQRLAGHVQALDLGSAGGFLLKLRAAS